MRPPLSWRPDLDQSSWGKYFNTPLEVDQETTDIAKRIHAYRSEVLNALYEHLYAEEQDPEKYFHLSEELDRWSTRTSQDTWKYTKQDKFFSHERIQSSEFWKRYLIEFRQIIAKAERRLANLKKLRSRVEKGRPTGASTA